MNKITLKLDLYEFNQVEKTCKTVAEKLGLRKDLIEKDLSQLTELLEFYREKQQHNKNQNNQKTVTVPPASATKCIEFLKTCPEPVEGSENLIQKFNKLVSTENPLD